MTQIGNLGRLSIHSVSLNILLKMKAIL